MRTLLRNKHFAYPLAAWLLFSIWFLALSFTLGAFDGFKAKTKDKFTFFSSLSHSRRQLDKDIVIVAVDNESLAKSGLKWPWKRRYFADLIEAIQVSDPAVIGIDFIYGGKSSVEDDSALAAAVGLRNNVVLAADKQSAEKALLPIEEVASKAMAVGYVNKPTDPDSVVRKARMFIRHEDYVDYPFELYVASLYKKQSLSSLQIKDEVVYWGQDFAVPVDEQGVVDINFTKTPNDFAIVSANKVMSGQVDKSFFEGKIVLIGATAKVIHDEINTPFRVIPGVIVLANTVSMLVHSNFLVELPYFLNIFVVLFLGLLVLYLSRKQNFLTSFLIFTGIITAWFAAMLFLRNSNYSMDFFTQAFLVSAAFVISNLSKYFYLIYISGKLKNLAVADPVTGFFSIRYLSLILDQKLKLKEKNLSLVAMGIREYKVLSKRYGFDDMKSFMRGFARFLETQLKSKLKKPIYARAHGGNFYILVSGLDREILRSHLDDLMHQVWSSGFSFGDNAEMIHLSIALLYTPVFQGVSGKHMYSRAEEELANAVNHKDDAIRMINIHEKIWDIDRSEGIDDELEFLSVDIEERNRELEEALKETEDIKQDVEEAYFAVVMSLVKALEEKDTYTQGHSERAAKFAKSIAKEIGMSPEDCEMIYKAGLLHDIGKIGVPESILHKKGRLTDEDFAMIKKHPVMGKKILEPIKAFADILPMVLFHHEKYDGTGYPHGLHGDSIPVGAQILAVADCFDAITCGRGYKQGTSLRDGMVELERCAGTQFNPIYVQAFKRVLNME